MTQTPAQFAAKLRRDNLTKLKRQIMTRIVVAVRGNVTQEAPIKSRDLRKSFRHKVERTGDRGVISNVARHAAMVHYGTKRHIILPKRPSGVLRFMIGGKARFARVVRHPGTKANRFMDRGLALSRDTIRTIIQEEAHLYIRSLL